MFQSSMKDFLKNQYELFLSESDDTNFDGFEDI